jgi:ubiquitin-conjugating enzyme E2 G1
MNISININMALKRLQSEYKQLLKEPNYFFSIEPNPSNFFQWNIILIGPPDSPFEGGIFNCYLHFPSSYPNKPPEFKFTSHIYHPNIYNDGRVCISILHEGIDEWGYEHVSERWNPSHSVNSILMSILSILSSPNFESPANVDASVMWKNNYEQYKKMIHKMVAKSH